jgi:cytochrome P450
MTAIPTVNVDPFTATGPGQRHAAYAALTAGGPVHRITLPSGEPVWLITGHQQVRQALHDPRIIKREATGAVLGRGLLPAEVIAATSSHMLNSNGSDHTRLRRLVSAAFTRRRIDQFAPRIQQITDELCDTMVDSAQVDLIDAFAYPLPITVICELLGVPVQRRAQFHDLSSITAGRGALGDPNIFIAASTAMVNFLQELVAAKRADPTDDLLSSLVTVRDGADQLSEDELTSMAWLLLVAGHETTVNLIGNGVHALLTHPEQLALLRAQPDRLGAAIEELLRFSGPVQVATPRHTTEPVTVGGITIPAGQIVIPALLAANRDPACATQPDTLDLTRTENPHLAFGHGIHHCLGAPLARLEACIAIGSLLARFPQLRLAVPPEHLTWRAGVIMHGLQALPVVLD